MRQNAGRLKGVLIITDPPCGSINYRQNLVEDKRRRRICNHTISTMMMRGNSSGSTGTLQTLSQIMIDRHVACN